jgi:DNA-directed RNA polymerase sigma subunit (sigma70/sigma32)
MTPTQERKMARAIFLTMEMRALRQRVAELAIARKEIVTDLHFGTEGDEKLSLRVIGEELGISGPRVHEIIKGKGTA